MSSLQRPIQHIAVLTLGVLFIGCSGKKPSSQVFGENVSVQHSDSANQTANGSVLSRLTYEQRQGSNLYRKYCAVCHGEDGKGSGFNAFNLDPKPRDFTDSVYMNGLTDERIIQTINGGGRSMNRSSLMPSWGGRLEKSEIKFVLSYIRTFAPSK